MADTLMLVPPDDEMSADISNKQMKFWRYFTLHTDKELAAFESKFLKVVPKSVKAKARYLISEYSRNGNFFDGTPKHVRNPVHIRLDEDSIRPTKASISCIFVACICLAFRDFFSGFAYNHDSELVKGIYAYFNPLEAISDFRNSNDLIGYSDIYDKVEKYGLYRTSRMVKQITNLCKPCSQKKKVPVYMTIQSGMWKCAICNEYDPIIGHYSIRHLKDNAASIREKKLEQTESIPRFKELIVSLINFQTAQPRFRALFMSLFHEHEKYAERGVLLCTKREFWAHYDKSKKSKRKWCPIKRNVTYRPYQYQESTKFCCLEHSF
jgi:hypothetical protein